MGGPAIKPFRNAAALISAMKSLSVSREPQAAFKHGIPAQTAGISMPEEPFLQNGFDLTAGIHGSVGCRLPAAAPDFGLIGTYTISSQACNTQFRICIFSDRMIEFYIYCRKNIRYR
jgi:hypothetical protein